jgi:apolipoprotein N-acyltransferase
VNALIAFFRRTVDSRITPWLAIAVGALNTLSFAPFSLWWVQILTLAWLFHASLSAPTYKRSLIIAWLYGLGWATAGTHWLFISMHEFGGMPAIMAALAVVLLAAYLGIYTALALGLTCYINHRLHTAPAVGLLLVLPACWALSEWLRGWLFTGFPWLTSGYAHSSSPFAGVAAVFGVYGLSAISALLAGALLLLARKQLTSRITIAALVLGVVTAGSLRYIDWTHPTGNPITTRLVQGNVPQEMKFASDTLLSSLIMYDNAIRAETADLIAIPETAIPLLPQQLPPAYLSNLEQYARTSGSHLILGIPMSDGPGLYANSALGIGPDSSSNQRFYRYDKQHLVPFGEFVPWGFQWFVDMMDIPLGDMLRGTLTQAAFPIKDQWVLPNICYEDLFGEDIVAQFAYAKAAGIPAPTVLLNLSNIAWFGDSIALPQHLQISQMRALETGRPMLRATNTGATAIIDPKGHIAHALPAFTRDTLSASVQGYSGQTPYIVWGNTGIVLLSGLILVLIWIIQSRRRRN